MIYSTFRVLLYKVWEDTDTNTYVTFKMVILCLYVPNFPLTTSPYLGVQWWGLVLYGTRRGHVYHT